MSGFPPVSDPPTGVLQFWSVDRRFCNTHIMSNPDVSSRCRYRPWFLAKHLSSLRCLTYGLLVFCSWLSFCWCEKRFHISKGWMSGLAPLSDAPTTVFKFGIADSRFCSKYIMSNTEVSFKCPYLPLFYPKNSSSLHWVTYDLLVFGSWLSFCWCRRRFHI